MKKLSRVFELLKDVLFPHICLCGKWGEVLCNECIEQIRKNKRGLCPICKKLSENGKTCSTCRRLSNLTGVMVFGKHDGLLKDAIWRMKYEHIRDLGYPLSTLVVDKFGNQIKYKDFLITYVPSSKERVKWRGFNQAEVLARHVAKALDLECQEAFLKADGSPQVGLTRKERIENLKEKISTKENILIKKSRVLIVDDVYTTGATLEECAKVLRLTGVKEVWGLVLSRE